MILTGLLAGATAGPVRFLLWAVSTAAMIALLYLVVKRLFTAAYAQSEAVRKVFNQLAVSTIILWSIYPVVWLLGTEGFGIVGSTPEVGMFLVLDVLAKVGFGFLLLTNRAALTQISRAK